jgi:creatinine amidohydrolase
MSGDAGATAREVQAELLSPAELDAALAEFPAAYLPVGSLEFHSSHLPIGLDALNAHGVCVGAARASGGIVLPSVYQGVGGGHSEYPWTIMMNSAEGIRSHLEQTLTRLEAFGVRVAVIFTGHFADEQLAMIDDISRDWNAVTGRALIVHATGVNRCESSPIAPDHAGVFETSLLHALRPELVHLDRLPALQDYPVDDPYGNAMGPQRHDPSNPLWGIFGPDPRPLPLEETQAVLDTLVGWLAGLVNRAVTTARSE